MTNANRAGGAGGRKWRLTALLALMVPLAGVTAPAAQAGPAIEKCVVIDNDFDIDDMMAIAAVIGNRHVAAIVNTEGVSTAQSGASAVSRLIAEPSERAIPVIIGADSHRSEADIRKNWPWLLYFRASMGRVNDLLTAPLPPSRRPLRDFVAELSRATADCRRIDLLITGPYTSFIRYSAALAPKLDHVVISGKPIGDPTLKPGQYLFNCGYDLPACRIAMKQLRGTKTSWVNISEAANPPYAPSLGMVQGLRADGLPGALKAALMANQHTWNPAKVPVSAGGPGGQTFMWDQTAAMYLLHPERFAPVGAHYGPRPSGPNALSPAGLHRLWTRDVNAARRYQ